MIDFGCFDCCTLERYTDFDSAGKGLPFLLFGSTIRFRASPHEVIQLLQGPTGMQLPSTS